VDSEKNMIVNMIKKIQLKFRGKPVSWHRVPRGSRPCDGFTPR